MGVLEIISGLGSAATGVGAIGSFGAGLYGGYLQNRQTERAQAYQDRWANRIYQNELKQQQVKNEMAQEQLDLNKAAQYFKQEMELRNEARNNTADWHTYMQNAANKYADVLNKTKALQKSNASALRNR